MTEIIYKEESFRIVGACFEVYNQKGFGFTEPVYQECMAVELSIQGIPFRCQPKIPLSYKGRRLAQYFKPDFICFEKIVLELKTVSALTDEHRAQALNYLYALDLDLALLVNFGEYPKVKYERLANTNNQCIGRTLSEEIRSWIEKQ